MTEAFACRLVDFAESVPCPHLLPIVARLRQPVRVAVLGRNGVGRHGVAVALRRRGVVVTSTAFDVGVVVVNDAVKAEDLALLRSVGRGRALVVLTKADLAGAGAGGPLAVARDRASAIRNVTGTPTVPVVGLLAALDGPLDHDLVAGLRTFVTEPPNLAGVDAFVDDPHPVGRDVRERLLARLDRFGIAHAVLALAGGADADHLSAHLARLGNVDEVLAALDAVAAPVRYRRVRIAMAELHSLAVQLDDEALAGLLATDDVVLAVMAAAVDVIEADGLSVDRGDTAAAHLDRAVRWRRYGRGPVNALHRRCSDDVVRGSLRLLDGVSGSPG